MMGVRCALVCPAVCPDLVRPTVGRLPLPSILSFPLLSCLAFFNLPPTHNGSMSKYLKSAALVLQVACGVQLFNNHVAEFTWCFGPSMLPTLNMTGDIVGFEHLTQRFSKLGTGDLVVAVSPTDPSKLVCKRIIGVPGDKVVIDPVSPHRQYITVPPGHYWLMGDNLSNSTDSRAYGPVSGGLVLGRVFARLWPSPKWINNGLEEIVEFS